MYRYRFVNSVDNLADRSLATIQEVMVMGCRIMVGVEAGCDVEQTCLFNSTKMVAFGPIMGDLQEAEAFVEWMAKEQGRIDLRLVDPQVLCNYWYPQFHNDVYAERLCTGCDMYDKETTGGRCEECLK